MKKYNVLQLFIAISLCFSLTACSYQSRPNAEVKSLESASKTSFPKELKKFYTQKINWTSCDDKSSAECAKIIAPLNYDDPSGKTITLEAKKIKGKNPIGTLFVNPGGPGGSGIEFVSIYANGLASNSVSDSYDIVGFDPRGVGKSTPVKCFTDKEMDKYREESKPSVIDKSHEENVKDVQDYAAKCEKTSGDIYKYINTISVAKDLDIWRHLVGDNFLNYFGYSYGTSVGATYIDLFPNNTGRIVLDGVVDTQISSAELQYSQAKGFENALNAFSKDCIEGKICPFKADTPEEVSKQIIELLDNLGDEGLKSEDGRSVNTSIALQGIVAGLYNSDAYPVVREALEELIDLKKVDKLLSLADQLSGRDEKGHYDNSNEALQTVNNLDYSLENLTDEEYKEFDAKIMKDAPNIGKFFVAQAELIRYWPVKVPRVQGVKAEPKHKILIVGTEGDPATPYEMAVNVAKDINNSYLLTWKNFTHGAYGAGSSCIQSTVDKYLLTGKLPKKSGLVCEK
ncbi:alpha/beta fold hydrolase [Actinomyces sp. zg-332]|uniref:alpha/beta hydrolase n=1 Tax=Actinomyces sp. zg-332 TaxID=2708340 RepID=UPI001421AC5B|nr:alpha/beta hydrolase [Actinomyces sp. zg-332]QPK94131.1 alpha/beta fold hydrolase [Actinomyces sp. zg-332]